MKVTFINREGEKLGEAVVKRGVVEIESDRESLKRDMLQDLPDEEGDFVGPADGVDFLWALANHYSGSAFRADPDDELAALFADEDEGEGEEDVEKADEGQSVKPTGGPGRQLMEGKHVEAEHRMTYLALQQYVERTGHLPNEGTFFALIAKDHVTEDPDYYKKLEQAGI